MRLFRFGTPGKEKPGINWNGKMLDASSFGQDYNENFFHNNGLDTLQKWAASNADQLPLVAEGSRIGSCVARPSKIICVGLNYSNHALETNMDMPDEPIIFFKSTSALSGPYDNLVLPRNSKKTDWEVEFAMVIGKKASYVDEQNALMHVGGYCVHNDYSEREFQLERGGQWTKGKGCDTFAPLGPYLVTPDEIVTANNLRLWLKVNGKPMQDSNTSYMIFKVPHIVSYISQFMTLLPGDVITTGTPPGVALGMKNPQYLKKGDVVELGIEGLGEQRQVVV